MRPRVGITCDHEYLRDSRGSYVGRHYASERYAQAVYAAGGEPYLLPHRKELDAAGAQALLAPMQGLVISGGHFDIDPAYYGQMPHPLCGPLAQDRTHFEAALVTAAWRHKMPLLGICGGMQVRRLSSGELSAGVPYCSVDANLHLAR
jgi:putative glutamine amidotransferase